MGSHDILNACKLLLLLDPLHNCRSCAMARSVLDAPNLSWDSLSAPCSIMHTNWRSVDGIASSTQPSWNFPSNVDLWPAMCLRKILAALVRILASEYLYASYRATLTSFLKARRISLPFLCASSSGISAKSWSFSLGVSIQNCSSRCLYRFMRFESRNTAGPSLLVFVSTK